MAELTRVSLPDLERLQELVADGGLSLPLTSAALQAAGLGQAWGRLAPFAGLDRQALSLLLQATIAERVQRPVPRLELVWTGPDPRGSRARDTGVVVRELFHQAQRSVLVGGYAFTYVREILGPLHTAMRDRGVEASFFVNVQQDPRDVQAKSPEAVARAFLARNWPFGDPRPELYYDPRTADPEARASLHAKCVVVDEEVALITSANFTGRAQTRNVELGVRIEDPAFARRVVEHWRALIGLGGFHRMG